MGGAIKGDTYPLCSADRSTANSKRSGLPGESPAMQGWKVFWVHGTKGAQIRSWSSTISALWAQS
ncbi:MAG: hypothetical protein OSA51_13800 [Octadecabacter sp.]|nr:hypothetical protein [Octadecabacter sp.]